MHGERETEGDTLWREEEEKTKLNERVNGMRRKTLPSLSPQPLLSALNLSLHTLIGGVNLFSRLYQRFTPFLLYWRGVK